MDLESDAVELTSRVSLYFKINFICLTLAPSPELFFVTAHTPPVRLRIPEGLPAFIG